MENQKISDFLADQLQRAPEPCQPFFLSFEDYWERKLWHQLTDALIEFFRLPESAPQRLPIFNTFVLSFADRINQLKFVSLGLMASTQCASKCQMSRVVARPERKWFHFKLICDSCG